MNTTTRALLACSLVAVTAPAQATLGIFEHGNGIKSMGMGGLVYAIGEEATTLSANPAHAASMGTRYDLGLHVFMPMADVDFDTEPSAPDSEHKNTGRDYLYVPQGGFSRQLDERWSMGMTAFAAGLGPDYPDSPYARFGGAQRASLFLNSGGISTALAYRLNADHAIGASFNLGYQTLAIEGMEFFGAVSSDPAHVSNQGKDGSFSAGFSLGWRGQLTPQLGVGVAYRSKSWTQKHKEYRGLLPDHGRLELPQIWGLGLAYTPDPAWTLGIDFQRYQYSAEPGFGNRLIRLDPANGRLLGDDGSAGFGFENQNVLKLGVAWKAAPQWTLRAGYVMANEMMRRTDTLFGMFGPVMSTTHYTAGATWIQDTWEISGFGSWAPNQRVKGENSIPPGFGGGEANVAYETVGIGLTFGRRF